MKYFVLKPRGADKYAEASRKAMNTYAAVIGRKNKKLAKELNDWVFDETAQKTPEVKSPTMTERVFKKNYVIKTESKHWECVIADGDLAIFAEIVFWKDNEKRVSYDSIFAVDQLVKVNFEYEMVLERVDINLPLCADENYTMLRDEFTESDDGDGGILLTAQCPACGDAVVYGVGCVNCDANFMFSPVVESNMDIIEKQITIASQCYQDGKTPADDTLSTISETLYRNLFGKAIDKSEERPLNRPVGYDLITLFKELKFGRPTADQAYLDTCIKDLDQEDGFANFGWALEQAKLGYAVKRTVVKNGSVITSYKGRLVQMIKSTGIRFTYVPTNADIHAADWELIV